MSTCSAGGIRLIVGLGNPGPEYEDTRHNAGFWFVDRLARDNGESFRLESRMHGQVCRLQLGSSDVRLLKPGTFMNRSGRALAAVAGYFGLDTEQILVVHDELDLPCGTARLKKGGGHGGHNGLRDIMAALGAPSFLRLRLGIGRPQPGKDVVGYVLSRPPRDERDLLEDAIEQALGVMPQVLGGDWQRAMTLLHSPP